MRIEFFLEGEPMGKERPRLTRTGHAFTPKKTEDYERRLAEACREAMQNGPSFPPDIPLRLFVHACFAPPTGASKRRKKALLENLVPCLKRPDLDNIAKIVLDGLQTHTEKIRGQKVKVPGAAFNDDAQITEMHVSKRWAEASGVFVRIEDMSE